MEVHIVVKGDTLWKIARQYGIPFEELKRVNAHLANPDYIVPGMKIFLPMDKKKPHHKGEPSKPHDKTPQKPEKPQQPEMKPPSKPAPKPEPKPQPKPPVQQVPPLPQAPQMPQMPMPQPPMPSHPAPQMPMQPNVPMWQAVFPICGWMPIFDADCHPHMPQQPPMQAPIKPMPPKESSRWCDESTHHHKPAPMPDGWQLIESSSLYMPSTPRPPAPQPPVMKPMPEQPKPAPMPMPQPMPQPLPMPQQPSIPPKACMPANWCPSNQDLCSQGWPEQQHMHHMPMHPEFMQPVQWYPCFPSAPMMPIPMPFPQQQPGQQMPPNYPMPIQEDWYRNP